jgi:hypothetical protein
MRAEPRAWIAARLAHSVTHSRRRAPSRNRPRWIGPRRWSAAGAGPAESPLEKPAAMDRPEASLVRLAPPGGGRPREPAAMDSAATAHVPASPARAPREALSASRSREQLLTQPIGCAFQCMRAPRVRRSEIVTRAHVAQRARRAGKPRRRWRPAIARRVARPGDSDVVGIAWNANVVFSDSGSPRQPLARSELARPRRRAAAYPSNGGWTW